MCFITHHCTFSASTLLDGRQEKQKACGNWVIRCWCGYLSGARCRLFAYGPADATGSKNPLLLTSYIQTGFYLSYRLIQVVLEKRPLNGCSSNSSLANSNQLEQRHRKAESKLHSKHSKTISSDRTDKPREKRTNKTGHISDKVQRYGESCRSVYLT